MFALKIMIKEIKKYILKVIKIIILAKNTDNNKNTLTNDKEGK